MVFFKLKVCNGSLVFSVGHKNWPFGKDGKLKSVIKTFSAKLLIMIVWYSCEKFSRQETLCLHLLIWRFFNFSYGRNNAMITSIIIWLSVEVQHNPQFFVLNWGDFGVELRNLGAGKEWPFVSSWCVELMGCESEGDPSKFGLGVGKIFWRISLKKNFTSLSTHSVRLFW